MKGNNTLQLNAATMIEALQLWADTTFKERVKVTAVREMDSSGRAAFSSQTFEVSTTDGEPGPAS